MEILKCCPNLLRLNFQKPNEENVSVNTSPNPILNYLVENPLPSLRSLRLVGRGGFKVWRIRLDAFLTSHPGVEFLDVSAGETQEGDEGELYFDQQPTPLPNLSHLCVAFFSDLFLTRAMPRLHSLSIRALGLRWIDQMMRSSHPKTLDHIENLEVYEVSEPFQMKYLETVAKRFPNVKNFSMVISTWMTPDQARSVGITELPLHLALKFLHKAV